MYKKQKGQNISYKKTNYMGYTMFKYNGLYYSIVYVLSMD